MAGIASQFIDLSDGEYHLIPANAINLVLFMAVVNDEGPILVEHSPDKILKYPIVEKDDTPGPTPPIPKVFVVGLNPIEEPICQYIKVASVAGAKLYFGVS